MAAKESAIRGGPLDGGGVVCAAATLWLLLRHGDTRLAAEYRRRPDGGYDYWRTTEFSDERQRPSVAAVRSAAAVATEYTNYDGSRLRQWRLSAERR